MTYDFVIVGGGSAGCVLANRLSADPSVSVLLLEAGGRNNNVLVRMPAGVATLIKQKSAHNWGFQTEPEPHMDDRRLWWPRGRGLGGSSAINGMIYIRGHRRDYDEWRQLGLPGWSWDDVAPYFHRLEGHHRPGEHHNGDGPLKVSAGESDSPFNAAFIEAGRQAGYPVTDDFNGPEQAGFGPFDLTIADGQRSSAAAAYLAPVRARRNLTVVTGARTTAVRLDGRRAVGVDYVRGKRGQVEHAAAREVLLCAGAVQTPQIMMLSGIGAPEALRAAGVAIRHELPGVGGNLKDHLDVVMNWHSKGLMTAFQMLKPVRQLSTGLHYLLNGGGMGRQQFVESGAFLPSREGLDRPDIQIHAILGVLRDHGNYPAGADGFSMHLCQLRPESRGRIGIASADPFADPLIHANYLATPEDRRVMREAVRIGRRVGEQAALSPYNAGEFWPGPDVTSDDAIDAWVRAAGETIYHPVGTCAMGPDGDRQAVVDAELRVRGLDGLRVVDASVMPRLVGGNTNAPTIMIAEKASDMILGRKAMAA